MDGIKRHQFNKISRLLESFPVVVLTGPRQCGKSTLARMVAPDWDYFDLENPVHFDRIHEDPVLFFQEYPEHIVIDEAQRSSRLFETLRGVVDQNRTKKGRFILTGSASFGLMKHISESLAGRVALIELAPFKVDESLGLPLSPFFQIFEKKIGLDHGGLLKSMVPTKSFQDLKKGLLWGGYPEPVLSNSHDFYLDWMDNYFDTYINRDMRYLFPRIDLVRYRRVLMMLAQLSGTVVNRSEIARSVEISEKSVRDYMEIISGTYFWRDLPAYLTSKIKTTSKLPKGHFRDSGLGLFLQNIHSLQELENFPRLGHFFEAFIVEELIRGFEASKIRNLKYFHFRTKAGAEIDLIVSGSFGILPIEIKYASHVKQKQITALKHFVEVHDLDLGLVISNTDKPSFLTEKIIQLPATCI